MSIENTSLFPLPPIYYKKYSDPPTNHIIKHDQPHEYTLQHPSAYSIQLLPPPPIIGEYTSFGVKYNTKLDKLPEFTHQSLKDQLLVITSEFSNVLEFKDGSTTDALNEAIKHFHIILNSFRVEQAERKLEGIIRNEDIATVELMVEIKLVMQKVNDLVGN